MVRQKQKTHPKDVNTLLQDAYAKIMGIKLERSLSPDEYILEVQHYFSEILDKIPCIVYWKNNNLHYMGCNNIAAEFSHFNSPKDIIGKTDYELFSDKKLASEYRKIDKKILFEENEYLNQPEELISPDGKRLFTLVSKAPIKDVDGKIVGLVGVTVDITKEKQAEIVKRNFLSNMEHDLRTPFAGIGGVADLLHSMYAEKYPELKELFEIMTKSCSKWQEIHNRIFDALDLGQELKVERFYIQDEIESIKDLMGSISKIKNIPIYLYYPPKESTGMVETDVLKLKLILSSLVGNAFNFTVKGNVTLKLRKNKTAFYIDIIDTGIGIPEDKYEIIFEEFTKLSRSNLYGEVFKGMGLGLYNAHRDAEKIHARITVKSILGEGSVFTLKLPIKWSVI